MQSKKSWLIGLAVVGASLISSAPAMAANSQITITTKNGLTTTISPSSLNYAGTIAPTPASISAGQSQTVYNSGISTVTSYHIDYSAGTKRCHYDASSWLANAGTGACTFNKAASSTGTTYATCTATITAMAPANPANPNCSFSVTFEMK